MRYGVALTGLAGILLVVFALVTASDIPTFPWTTFAKGPASIMQEPGIKTAGQIAGCRLPGGGEVQVVIWHIIRANGEQWSLYATVDPPARWVAVRYGASGGPDRWYAGTHEGDTIQLLHSKVFSRDTHGGGPCPYLTAPPA